ncbi:hypothetical protein KZX45_00860 [Georgenia sp. EYE_87]|uniref:RNase H family protein n=1 Tax=Georgenia sp. EYE_87 TaxID=2853448 RepID=UPI002005D2DC|nr:RNase H family protein [Georgenia sp. EYE_87]MCK6209092.1 hypothetical protein [Georgenia sp. EYE_87]
MEEWATQDELGKQLGIDAQSVGDLLVAAGLKLGRQATDDALHRGLASPGTTSLGRPFVRWRADEVLPLIEPLALRMAAAPARSEPTAGTRRRAAPKPRVRVPGTTFDVVVALHAVADPNPGPTGWAYVNQETWEATSGGLPNGTDSEGELVAALYVLDHSAPGAHLLVRSASEYLVKTATVWGPNWQRNGWRKRDGERPENLELIEPLLTKIGKRVGRVRFGLADIADEFIVAAAQRAREAAREITP